MPNNTPQIYTFESDNCGPAHPKVLEALINANSGHVPPYGADAITRAAEDAFDALFGRKVYTFFTFCGTGANCALLSHVTRRFGGVICALDAHINTAETGAPERIAGVKLYPQGRPHGKLSCEFIETMAEYIGYEHYALPDVVSITQPNEWGELYTPGEIRLLSSAAHKHGMKLIMDGARIACAAAALNLPIAEFTADAGVDAMVFGGTKNALLYGEAVVFFDEKLAGGFKYTRKATGQLSSKARYIAAQFLALLKDGLWLETARHANAMAQRLADALEGAKGVELKKRPETNMLFAKLSPGAAEALSGYEFVEQGGYTRFVTGFSTSEEDVDAIASIIRFACR